MSITNGNAQQENGLPVGWVWTTLGRIADTTRKRVQPQDHPNLRFVGMEHVEAHTMRILTTVSASEMRSSAEYFEPGDVLYGRLRPYLNKVFCADFTGLCSGEFIPFRKTAHVTSKYLLYFLNSWEFASFASHLNEGDRPRVSFDQLTDYPFPLAPLLEQHRIVTEIETQFTRLDAGVAALKRVQANLRRYKASVLKAACEGLLVPTEAELARVEGREYEPASVLLEHILAERRAKWEQANPGKRYVEPKGPDVDKLAQLPEGWVWASMEQLIADFRSGSTAVPQDNVTPFPILRSSSVRPLRVDLSDLRYLQANDSIVSENYLQEGDLLYTRLSGSLDYVGNCALVISIGDERIQYPDRIFRAKLSRRETSHYLQIYFASPPVRKQIMARAKSTAGHQRISMGAIREQSIALPPIAEQHRIVAEVERRLSVVQEVEDTVAANLKRAERLRQSILKRTFEGRLVAQDANDEPASALLERIRRHEL